MKIQSYRRAFSPVQLLIITAVLALLAMITAPKARAQYVPVALTIPNVTAGAVSNFVSLNQVIDCTDQSQVTLSITSSATNSVWRLSGSVDSTYWDTNRYVITVAPAIVGQAYVTNLNVGGLGKVRVDSVESVGTINATNTVTYGVKKSHW